MTLEERIQVCRVCSNRKFDPESGLLCGLNGAKPSFEGTCGDYQEDAAARKAAAEREAEAEKPSEIKGFLAFFLYFSIPAGIIGTLIGFFANFHAADYAGSFCLKAFDVVYLLFYLYFSIYVIYAFIKRKPDAVFLAKYLLITLALSNILVLVLKPDDDGFFTSPGRIVGSLIWSAIFFIYLCASGDVEDRIPKKTRKLSGRNKTLFILSIVLPILLLIGGVAEIFGQVVGSADAEKQIARACELNKKTSPTDLGDGLLFTDMLVEGDELVYEYRFPDVSREDYTDTQRELMALLGMENIKMILPTLSEEDPIFSLLKKAGYAVAWQYRDRDGESLYRITIPTELVAASLGPDYSYETPQAVMESIIRAFNENLPYELEENCSVRNIFLDGDGKTLHYEMLLLDSNSASLARTTPALLRGQIAEVLPYIQDAPLTVAKLNGRDLSFDFRADSNPTWKMSVRFTPQDYGSGE